MIKVIIFMRPNDFRRNSFSQSILLSIFQRQKYLQYCLIKDDRLRRLFGLIYLFSGSILCQARNLWLSQLQYNLQNLNSTSQLEKRFGWVSNINHFASPFQLYDWIDQIINQCQLRSLLFKSIKQGINACDHYNCNRSMMLCLKGTKASVLQCSQMELLFLPSQGFDRNYSYGDQHCVPCRLMPINAL